MNEQAQGEIVHAFALGEGERFAHEAAQSLTQGAVPAFDVVGLALGFAAQAVRALGEHPFVGQPKVAAGRPAAVVRGDALAQGTGTFGRTIPHEEGDDLAGLAAKRDPHPAGVGLGANEAPEFVQLQNVARLGRQKRFAQGWQAFGFFFSQPEIVLRATPKTRWAARRLRRSVATACSTSAWRSGAVSRLLGCKTRHAPQARQRNCWWPQTFLPFLTMRSLPHAVQYGAASAAKEDFLAITHPRRSPRICHLTGSHYLIWV